MIKNQFNSQEQDPPYAGLPFLCLQSSLHRIPNTRPALLLWRPNLAELCPASPFICVAYELQGMVQFLVSLAQKVLREALQCDIVAIKVGELGKENKRRFHEPIMGFKSLLHTSER